MGQTARKRLDPNEIHFDINVDAAQLRRNVEYSTSLSLPQVRHGRYQNRGLAIVGGGPSLPDTLDELRCLRDEENYAIVAVNGAHEYLQDQDIFISACVIVDAQTYNARFVKRPIQHCKYLIASQCDPSVFIALKGYDVTLFHAISTRAEREVLTQRYFGNNFYAVTGGSTAMLRSLTLFDLLGFRKFQMFGFDSCLMGEAHHAYPQPENDGGNVIDVELEGRTFKCHPWMWSQADEFAKMAGEVQDRWQIIVHGDGLISHMVKSASRKAQAERLAEAK